MSSELCDWWGEDAGTLGYGAQVSLVLEVGEHLTYLRHSSGLSTNCLDQMV